MQQTVYVFYFYVSIMSVHLFGGEVCMSHSACLWRSEDSLVAGTSYIP